MRSTLLTPFLLTVASVSASYSDATAHRRHHQRVKRQDSAPRSLNNSDCSPYSIVDRFEGSGFFDDWDFFTNSDPTHGAVTYQNEASARSQGLAYVQADGVAVMKVDSTTDLPWGTNRNSVRITTKKKYDGGLFIFDIAVMPYGASLWPAAWTVGGNWPNQGEIDIIEGVHSGPTNQYTIHSRDGCTTDTSSTAPAGFNVKALTSTVGNTNCASGKTDNTGCAFIDTDKRSYGAAFNAAGGGVFAMLWNDDGVKIWNFPRDEVPSDIKSQGPDPANWSSSNLKAAWAASTCSPTSFLKQHSIVFDQTICGDWAGATYSSAGFPGTCTERVMTGSNYKNAVWKINSVAVYQ